MLHETAPKCAGVLQNKAPIVLVMPRRLAGRPGLRLTHRRGVVGDQNHFDFAGSSTVLFTLIRDLTGGIVDGITQPEGALGLI